MLQQILFLAHQSHLCAIISLDCSHRYSFWKSHGWQFWLLSCPCEASVLSVLITLAFPEILRVVNKNGLAQPPKKKPREGVTSCQKQTALKTMAVMSPRSPSLIALSICQEMERSIPHQNTVQHSNCKMELASSFVLAVPVKLQ